MKRVIKIKGMKRDGGCSKDDVGDCDEKDSEESQKESDSVSQKEEADSVSQHGSDMQDEIHNLEYADCSSNLGDDEPPQFVDAAGLTTAIDKANGHMPDASQSGLQSLIRQHGLQNVAQDSGFATPGHGVAAPYLPELQLPVMDQMSLLQGMMMNHPANLPALAGLVQPGIQGSTLDQLSSFGHSGLQFPTGRLSDVNQIRGLAGSDGLFESLMRSQMHLPRCAMQLQSQSGQMQEVSDRQMSHGPVGEADSEHIQSLQKGLQQAQQQVLPPQRQQESLPLPAVESGKEM